MANWQRGHIGRFWDDGYKNLEYTRQSVTYEEIEEWKSKGYDYVKSYTGMMYDNRNPMPEWVEQLKTMFPYDDMTFTFYKMQTLEIMPEHSDHYRTYTRLHNAEYKNVKRILVMLEDWKPGHYLEVNGVGVVNWIAGDYFMWDSDCPHAASNIGIEDRYTLQITCTDNTKDTWTSLHWYNIPGLVHKKSSFDPSMTRILSSIYSELEKPMYIYMYNQHIFELEKITHAPDAIDHLNNVGLDIYLVEPLCSYKPHQFHDGRINHTFSFYSEFDSKENMKDLMAAELDSIQLYIRNNKLTNVTVHTCDYNVEKFYSYYSSDMKLITDDLFVKSIHRIIPKNDYEVNNFTKKFISANWRYTLHRHLIAMHLANKPVHLSWYFRSDFGAVAISKWYNLIENNTDFNSLNLLRGIERLNKTSPLNLDLNITEAVSFSNTREMQYYPTNVIYDHLGKDIANNNNSNNSLEIFYKDIFCDVVTESRFAQPTGNYSEKVYQPMFYKKPFILVAPPETLKYLKEQGFKTFSDFWDEGYDEIWEHDKRLQAIFDIIDLIDKNSIDELKMMYSKMHDILEHNYNLAVEKLSFIERRDEIKWKK